MTHAVALARTLTLAENIQASSMVVGMVEASEKEKKVPSAKTPMLLDAMTEQRQEELHLQQLLLLGAGELLVVTTFPERIRAKASQICYQEHQVRQL